MEIVLIAIIVGPLVVGGAVIAFMRRGLRNDLDDHLQAGRVDPSHPDFSMWLRLYRKWGLEPPHPHGHRRLAGKR